MSKEELMKPRVRLIAPIPFYYDKVGCILTSNDEGIFIYPEHDEESCHLIFWKEVEKYPHLFKELAWYEERKIEDMPQYLKLREFNIYVKVNSFVQDRIGFLHGEHNSYGYSKEYLPATESEYLQQTK